MKDTNLSLSTGIKIPVSFKTRSFEDSQGCLDYK